MTNRTTALIALCATLAVPTLAQAQASEQVRQAQAELSYEPEVANTAQQALRYFRINPGALEGLRNAARTRALLPVIAGGYQYALTRDEMFSQQDITDPNQIDANSAGTGHMANVGVLWDLRQLGFNSAEVEVYGLIAVQRDILLEVTRTYFLRRQLQLRLRLRPPEDALAYAALELRILEFTATLDVLTGGWFSEEADRRRSRTGGR